MEEGNKSVKLTISGKVSFSEDITTAQAAQIIAFVDSQITPAFGAVSNPISQPRLQVGGGTAMTAREALEASGAKTNPEKIVAFALQVGLDGSKDTFSLEDVKPLFRRARESTPGNITRDMDAAIKAGWVADADAKGEYYVTDKASRVLESGFEAIRGGRTTAKSRAKTSAVRKARKVPLATPEAFKNIDEIPQVLPGHTDFHKLKTKTDKFLWTLFVAKHLGVASVENKEIVWLSDRLGDGIATNDIAANYRANFKSGYVNRSTQDNKIRILPAGEAHLKASAE